MKNKEDENLFEVDLSALEVMDSSGTIETQKQTPPTDKKDDAAEDKEDDSSDNQIDLNDLVGDEPGQKTADEVDDDDSDEDEAGLKDIKKTPESKERSSSSPLISLLAKSLSEEGILAGVSEEELEKAADAKAFTELIRKQIKDNEFADLNDKAKTFLEAYRAGIPADLAAQSINNQLAYEGITDEVLKENEEIRRILIKNEFLAKGFSEEKAERLTKKSVDLGEDLVDAKEALASLKELEATRLKEATDKAKADQLAAREKSKKDLEEYKTKILNTEEIIKGIKVPPAMREKVFETLTKAVAHDAEGKPLNAINAARAKDPKSFDMALAYFFELTKGFTDFKDLKAPIKTSAMKELDEKLKSTAVSGGNAGTLSASGKSLREAINKIDPKQYL